MTPNDEAALESLVGQVADEFTRSHQRGEGPRVEEYVERYPNLADLLREILPAIQALSPATDPKTQTNADTPLPESAVNPEAVFSGERTADQDRDRRELPPGPPPVLVKGYEVLEELGRGGMGVVYKARQIELRRTVALKMLRAGAGAAGHDQERFRREAQAAAGLQHPHIVQLFEVGEADGQPFLALEYMDGGTLEAKTRGEPQPPRAAARLVETLGRAVAFAHQQGLVHRDLKPANILLSVNSGEWIVDSKPKPTPSSLSTVHSPLFTAKIADFGLAKRLDGDAGQTQSGAIVGTPSYMAPEQAAGGTKVVGPAADVYALGAILYELITGRPPLKGPSVLETLDLVRHAEPPPPSQLQPRCPRDLETICLKCLRKEPDRRYASALELADDLQRFLADRPVLARPVTAVERGWRWCRRNPALALASAAVLALLIAVPVVATVGYASTSLALGEAEVNLEKAERAEREAKQAWSEEARQKKEVENEKKSVAKERDLFQQLLYVANMRLAHSSWDAAEIPRMKELLDLYLPRPGQLDPRGWEWFYLYHLCHNHALTLPGPHSQTIIAVAWSPDGRWLASASWDRLVKVWEVATGKEHLTFKRHQAELQSLAWSPDSQRIATADRGGKVKVWEAATGKELFTREFKLPGQMTWSPDGQQLLVSRATGLAAATLGLGQRFEVWDAASGKELQVLPVPKNVKAIPHWALSPDGNRLALHYFDIKKIFIWDLKQGKAVSIFDSDPSLISLAWKADSKWLAGTGINGIVYVWDAVAGKERLRLHGQGPVHALAWRPDGKQLATAGLDRVIHVWDPLTGKELHALRGHTYTIRCLAWSPNGKNLASGGLEGHVKIWRNQPQGPSFQLPGTALCWQPRGKQLVVGQANGLVLFRDWDTGQHTAKLADLALLEKLLPPKVRKFPDLDDWAIMSLALSPDKNSLAVQRRAGYVEIWDLQPAPQRIHLWQGEPVSSTISEGLHWSPVQQRLVTFGLKQQATIWDTISGQERAIAGAKAPVWGVAWSPDGRRLATLAQQRFVVIWDATTGKETCRLPQVGGSHLVWSPDGRWLAVVQQTDIRIWDVDKATLEATLHGHHSPVSSLAWSPDNRRLASWGGDATLIIWDMTTRQEVFKSAGQEIASGRVSWCPDGHRLAIVTASGIQVWAPTWAFEQHPPRTKAAAPVGF